MISFYLFNTVLKYKLFAESSGEDMPKKRGRRKGMLYPQIKTKIRRTIEKYPGASTNEVASRAGVGWTTAKKYLNVLKREKKVKSRKRGSKTIWI